MKSLSRVQLLATPCTAAYQATLPMGFSRQEYWSRVPCKQWLTLFFWAPKITTDGDCSHEIKRRLLLRRKVMTHQGSIFKGRDITLPTMVRLVKAMILPVAMYGCWRRQWHPTPVFLPRKSHGQRSLVGCSTWGR